MSKPLIPAFTFGRKVYGKLLGRPRPIALPPPAYTGAAASAFIREKLAGDQPVMISRFGSVELECVVNYIQQKGGIKKYVDYVQGRSDAFWWKDETLKSMSNNAGFFPASEPLLEKFSELMLADMQCIDVLGSWRNEERFFEKELSTAVRLNLADLEPYYHANPWSEILTGKKVLVIHPFEASILHQYPKRKALFADQRILPDFELKTIKAVQSIANSKTGFKDWFEALEFMKAQVDATDFDIAIIGCGAYGLPLAAHVKRIGKKAVHLGGATQLLFGIMGRRWEDNDRIMKMVNASWVKPLPAETPDNFKNVEEGTYW